MIKFDIITIIIYGILFLLFGLLITFILDNKNSSNESNNIEERFTNKKDIKDSKDSKEDNNHNETFKTNPKPISKIDKFENPYNILKIASQTIYKGGKKFAKLIDSTVKQEISVKVSKTEFNPYRYLIIFDTEDKKTQKLLKKHFSSLIDYCDVNSQLMEYATKKLKKFNWKCCEIIYAIDTQAMTEKIYICQQKTRNIYSMEKHKKVYSERIYKAITPFISNSSYKKYLNTLFNDDAKHFIKHIDPNNLSDFSYQKRVDGVPMAYNLILDDKYKLEDYSKNLMELSKDINIDKKVRKQFQLWMKDNKEKYISWIAAISSENGPLFSVYIRI